jgi:hypothetical protein
LQLAYCENVRLASVIAAAILAVGCDAGPNLRGVSGSVTLDGAPVADGSIEFTPVEGTKGQIAGAAIKEGRYAVPEHHGVLIGGTYKVAIVSMRKTGRAVEGFTDGAGRPLPEFENYIPAKYNDETELEITISDDDSPSDFVLQGDD